MLNTEGRGVDEAYASAAGSSNLKSEAECRDDTDILRAAACNQSRLGAALLRLYTEWDRAEHPKAPTRAQIDALFITMPQFDEDGARIPNKRRHEMAQETAWGWYIGELEFLMRKLKALPFVRRQVVLAAEAEGWPNPAAQAPEVLGWWLFKICPVCHGERWQVAGRTGRLTGRACMKCQGTGHTKTPHGNAGRDMAQWLDDCLSAARDSIKKRLRGDGSPQTLPERLHAERQPNDMSD